MKFIEFAMVILPFVDPYLGSDFKEALLFLHLRCLCQRMKTVIRTPVMVDNYSQIFWRVLICGLARSYPVHYQIQRKVRHVARDYVIRQNWLLQNFSDVTDARGNRMTPLPKAMPVPKSKAEPVSKMITLTVYGVTNIFELKTLNTDTVESVKMKIQEQHHIAVDRMTLHFHSPSRLIELDDIKQMSDYGIDHGDSLTLFLCEPEWEDNSVAELIEQTEMLKTLDDESDASLTRKAMELRELLDRIEEDDDKQKLEDLYHKYSLSRANYRKASQQAQSDLKEFREFDRKCSQKYGFGGSSSSGRR
jgi:hypothetical protein